MKSQKQLINNICLSLLILLSGVTLSAQISTFTYEGQDIKMVTGNSVYWLPRGQTTTANKVGNSLNINRQGQSIITQAYSTGAFSLSGYIPSTLDSVVYLLNTQYFNDSLPTLGSVTVEPGTNPIVVTNPNITDGSQVTQIIWNTLRTFYTTSDNFWDSSNSPYTITGQNGILCSLQIYPDNSFVGSINGVPIFPNEPFIIQPPDGGGELPDYTLVITAGKASVFTLNRQ